MTDKPGNDTPHAPDVSEAELREMKVDELRHDAQDENINGSSGMRKEQLVKEVANVRSKGGVGAGGGDPLADDDDLDAGTEAGKLRLRQRIQLPEVLGGGHLSGRRA